MNNTDEIKARIDAVDLISESVQLRRSGKNYSGFCPFHENTRTPAFVVFPESGTWRCFGQCNEGGDIFNFVMKKEGWEFPEALRYLAERAGVQLQSFTPAQEAQREENDRLRDLLEDAVIFFRHQLLNTPAGAPALEYLQDRGLRTETIEAWGLGYAPNSFDACIKHFSERGYSLEDLIASGMVTEREDGRTYDRFRHRVTFAIRDERGRMAGFGARTLEKDGIPKYLNSPQTELFDKSAILYGLDQARRAIRAEEQAVVVEGYMDVIALHQAGFNNAVSPMGTALTERQLGHLKRRTKQMILALDADAAGNRATLRGLQLARETFDREAEIEFDPRGLLRQEARLQADIRIATLPEGQDPDDVVNRDPDEWRAIIDRARPIVVHVMETLGRDRDLSDPKVKSEIAAEVLPLINDLPNAFERDTYTQRLARFLKVDERTLFTGTRGGAGAAGTRRRTGRAARESVRLPERPAEQTVPGLEIASTHGLEIFCLGVLMRNPGYVFRVNRALKKAGLHELSTHDFQDAGHQDILRVIVRAVDQDFDVPQQVVIASLPLQLHDRADLILSKTDNLVIHEARLLEELFVTVIDIRTRNLDQNLTHLQFLMEEEQAAQDLELMKQVNRLTITKNLLHQAKPKARDRTILNG